MLLTSFDLFDAPPIHDKVTTALNLGGVLNNSLIKVLILNANFNPSSLLSTPETFFTSSSPFSFNSCLANFTYVCVLVPTYNNLKAIMHLQNIITVNVSIGFRI